MVKPQSPRIGWCRSRHLATLLAALVVAGSLAPGSAGAQTRRGATLYGLVESTEGLGVPDVEIVLPMLGRTTRTDSLGRWRMTGVAAGVVDVVARKVGYVPETMRVEMTERGAPLVTIVLRRSAQLLDPVIASARREALPGTFRRAEKNIGRRMFAEDIGRIRTPLYSMLDLLAVMRGQTGVPMRFLGNIPACRGYPAVFVDGRQLPHGTPLDLWVRPYEVEVIETMRGAQAIFEERRLIARVADSLRQAGVPDYERLVPKPEVDIFMAQCDPVVLIYTKEFVRRGRKVDDATVPRH